MNEKRIEIDKQIIYRSKSNRLLPVKWKTEYTLFLFFNQTNYSYSTIIYGIFQHFKEGKLYLRKFISYQNKYSNLIHLKEHFLKDILSKYGFKIKYIKLYHQLIDKINTFRNHYDNVISRILSPKIIPTLIKTNIIPFLY